MTEFGSSEVTGRSSSKLEFFWTILELHDIVDDLLCLFLRLTLINFLIEAIQATFKIKSAY